MPNYSLRGSHSGQVASPTPHTSTMDGSMKLVVLSIVMLLGSYLAGSIPLFIAMSEEKLQVINLLVMLISINVCFTPSL